jgi:uridine phosphorylase
MEELAAAGARCFVGLGMAGSLQEVAPIGSFLLPGECLREEGTSAHYLRPGETPGPDPCLRDALERALTASGLTATRGWHWTTDAIYREFTWKIERYRAEGVLSVDMETSAMYAFGCLRRLPVANLLVVSDELWREWRPGFHSDELRRALGLASTAILDHLTELDGAWRGPTDV